MSDMESAGPSVLGRLLGICWKLGGVGVGLAGLLGFLLYFKQDSLLYYPEIAGLPRRPKDNPRGYRSPGEARYNMEYQDVMIPCADGVHIHAWLIQHSKTAPTVLFFHGNAGNIGLRLPNALQMLQQLRVNVLMVEYRGYGNSDTVSPTEAGLKLDAEASLRFVQTHDSIDASQIYLYGQSLGGAVAVHLAHYAQQHHFPLRGVVLENTFTSISDMVDKLMPFLKPIKKFVLRLHWDSKSIISHLEVPILFLAGARDELVPHFHMQTLYQLAKYKTMHVIRNGTHNESWAQGGSHYWAAFSNFIHGNAKHTSMVQSAGIEVGSVPVMRSGLVGMAKDAFGYSLNTGNGGFKKEL